MMDERCENISPLLFAFLADRMSCQMSVTDPAPYAAIPLVLIVATGKMLVMSLHDFLVRLTVTAFSVRKVRTACHAAGSFRFTGHRTPPRGIKKALAEKCFSEKADFISYSC